MKQTVQKTLNRLNSLEIHQESVDRDVRGLFDKNNCFDIFKNSMIDNEHIYEPMLNRQRVQLKVEKKKFRRFYQKISMICSLKAVDRILMVRARLKLIEL